MHIYLEVNSTDFNGLTPMYSCVGLQPNWHPQMAQISAFRCKYNFLIVTFHCCSSFSISCVSFYFFTLIAQKQFTLLWWHCLSHFKQQQVEGFFKRRRRLFHVPPYIFTMGLGFVTFNFGISLNCCLCSGICGGYCRQCLKKKEHKFTKLNFYFFENCYLYKLSRFVGFPFCRHDCLCAR